MFRALWAVMLILLCTACKGDTPKLSSDFEASPSTVEISEEGGDVVIEYRLKEYVGSIMPVVTTTAEWITNIDNSTKGEISFRVAPNFSNESRETTLELRYVDIDTKPQIVVRQTGQSGEKLSIEITELGYSECSVMVTPENDSMSYIVMMAEKAYFTQSNITDEETLIAADYSLFLSYIVDGTIEEFVTKSGIAMQGANSKRWQDLSPAK